MSQSIQIHQIAYNESTRQQVVQCGFHVLDNMSNERPDWYEYWPIRRYLLTHTLESDTWYGFFSPKFTEKTGLDEPKVRGLISNFCATGTPDVILFCPQPDMGAFFLNVFEQAEFFDPGFNDAATRILSAHGMQVSLSQLVMDSQQIVFSNYFVARSDFWKEWFDLSESIFAIAEDPGHELQPLLCHRTTYSGEAQRKTFLIERLASLLLTVQPRWKTAAANPFNFAWSTSRLREFPHKAYISDALKMAFRETGYSQYMDAFSKLRQEV